jgi:UDP-glucose 4-epimerase
MILVTGGAGYIGTHTCIELMNAGYKVVIFDNLSNASREAIKRVECIVQESIPFIEGDIRNKKDLQVVFDQYPIEAVIHFAGLKAVGESVDNPLKYYDNNVTGTVNLCNVMKDNDCKSFIFSSSATVYGDPYTVPITEAFPLSATNPYGRSKLMIEEILRDIFLSDKSWEIVLLRYFNPVGAHTSGMIGEDPKGKPNNLMPFISQTAVGKFSCLNIFGNDYDTKDGTGVRDYIHVVDLAKGHVKALEKLATFNKVMTFNLGRGEGYSVKEMVEVFEKVSQRKIPCKILPRRAGDIAECYADVTKAKEILNWNAKKGIDEMCADTWKWQLLNPNGFDSVV